MFSSTNNTVLVVQGSFNQSHPKFGETAGVQCGCNSLFSICWSKIHKVNEWTQNDLDHVLNNGDRIYKFLLYGPGPLNEIRYLDVDDLPHEINLPHGQIGLDFLELKDGELSLDMNDASLVSLFYSANASGDGFLLICNGLITAVIYNDTQNSYFYFDSHSRNQQGFPVSDGTSVLLKFSRLCDIENYLKQCYLHAERRRCYFQVQFIKVILTDSSKCSLRQNFRNELRRNVRASTIGSPEHENSKQQKRDARAKSFGSPEHENSKKQQKDARAKSFGSPEHENSKKQKKDARAKSFGSPEHENSKQQKRDARAKSFGSPEHENSKQQKRDARAKSFGSPEHENSKKQKRDARAKSFGSPEHENSKQQKRDARAKSFGSPEHENSKKQKKDARAKSFGSPEHENSKKQKKATYAKFFGSSEHEQLKQQKRAAYFRRAKKCSCRVSLFKEKVQQGPFYICVVCHRSLYFRSVLLFNQSRYDPNMLENIIDVLSFDGKRYICKTCDTTLRKKKLPCQSVSNKLHIFPLPNNLKKIFKLEHILASKRLLFKKINIMQKGRTPKITGNICNIPIEINDTATTLPREPNNNGLVMVKLKRKLEYRGYVYFENVRPLMVQNFLYYLKEHNHLYHDINIDLQNIPQNLIHLIDESQENSNQPFDVLQFMLDNQEEDIPIQIEDEFDQSNPLDEFRTSANETVLISNLKESEQIEDEIFNVAPGEGQSPLSILTDDFCEELAHPHLFPTGKFGYKVEREIRLTPSRYFNQRLLNYTQKFASDTDYIFFANSVLQQLALNSSINIAMQKVAGDNLTAGMLSRNFKDTVKQFIASDKAFSFMSNIKGTPAYWKRFMHEVLSMVKAFGPPDFFLTLSCADLRWNELVRIISRLKGDELSDDQISKLKYEDRCDILNGNPVLLARHFQYRVESFFKHIALDGPLGKTKYYAIRVEFQVRGSPHVHCFLWTENSPKLTPENKLEYLNHVDSTISAILPDSLQNPELYKLVKTYQLHKHSFTCVKNSKKKECRFRFGRYFTERTIIAEPLSDTATPEEKTSTLNWRKEILKKVKTYIDSKLNPAKNNFFDPDGANFEEAKSMEEILTELEISLPDYMLALSISEDSDYHIYLKRPTNSCFVNNYFKDGLSAWEANLDLQPVFNHYKAITYMCAYLSKTEDECSNAMKQALREAYENRKDINDQMRAIANAYNAKRELSVQEAVYHIMPELWLRKTFPTVDFANSNLPDKRYRICLTEDEVRQLPEDSTDIFKRNMIDRYIDRPNRTFKNGIYQALDSFCLAEFLRYYRVLPKTEENDSQPNEFSEDLIEGNHEGSVYPAKIPLMTSPEKLRCRKVPCVLRYHVPNRHRFPDRFAHHLLFLFYPFRSEAALLSTEFNTYIDKLNEPGILELINSNRSRIEPYTDLVEEAFTRFRDDLPRNSDSYGQQENDEVIQQMQEALYDDDEEQVDNEGNVPANGNVELANNILNDDEVDSRIRGLNVKQRSIFNLVHKWARDFVKNSTCKNPKEIKPFHIFLTGGGGVGKSRVLTTVYHSVTKLLMYRGGEPDKKRILVLSPTGVAAVNVDGTTIHTGLAIQIRGKNSGLHAQIRASLRQKLQYVELVLIDEISMVSKKLFELVDLRLREITGCKEVPFGGKPVMVCGDLFQLPPIRADSVYHYDNENVSGIRNINLWDNFCIAELTEVMRQKGDDLFIDLLNKVRTGDVDECAENLLRQRFVKPTDVSYPHDALHIFAENAPAKIHNEAMLNRISEPIVEITAIDEIPRECNIPDFEIRQLETAKPSDTGGLPFLLSLKLGARVMIVKNIDLEDRLINGQIATVTHFKYNRNNQIVKIYVNPSDERAGLKAMNSDSISRENSWVPIERAESSFTLKGRSQNSMMIRRTQFPLMLAWACTCHKIQSLSIPEAVISFTLVKQRRFFPGQMYVALSRVTSLNGLHLLGNYSSSAIQVNVAAKEEYDRLRIEKPFVPNKELEFLDENLTITLLNTRSLRKHAIDIKHDRQLVNNDVLCLTETQLMPNEDNAARIEEILSPYHIEFNNSQISKFMSLAFCLNRNVVITEHEKHEGLSILSLRKPSFANLDLKVALIYRQPNSQRQVFYEVIRAVLERQIDILLGDFNINAFDNNNDQLQEILRSYKLIVNEPTHLSGSLIDHVYIKKTLLENYDINNLVANIYFSDHDAVCFQLVNKS